MLFFKAFLFIMIFLTFFWVVSVKIKNASIVDILWSLLFIIACATYFFYDSHYYYREIIVFGLVTIWALRLSLHLAIRNIGKPEDYRYQNFRKDYGAHRYWWFSFFQVFLLQGALAWIVSLPLLAINTKTFNNDLFILDYIGFLFWIIGFLFEAIGDYQLTKFKRNTLNKGKVLNTGLWKYTRHPNYFGNAMMWIGFGLLGIAVGGYYHFIGPIIMVTLLLKVSGVRMLEATLKETKPQYKDYIQTTNSFVPWFPKRKKND